MGEENIRVEKRKEEETKGQAQPEFQILPEFFRR